MKKSLVLALVAVLVLSFASMASAAFTDTTSHWANPYINALVGKNVVSGTTATTFVPDGKVTRAEFAKMIVNAKGLALENPANAKFSDVAPTAWYYTFVETAAKAGYIDGTGNGKFEPTALVTREQVAKMIVLAAGKSADATKAINFDDKASISDWAKGFVAVAADLKLVEGYNNKFSPKANATRAEAAKLTYNEMRYEGKIEEVVVVSDDMMTELNTDTVVIGGKTYDLAGDVDYIVGSQLVTKDALVENTKVKFALNASGKVNKITVDAPDYKFVKGEVTSTGDDGDAYVVIADKKVYIDKADSDYYYAEINEDDEFENASNDPVATDLVVNKDYLVIYNSKNFATYALKLSSTGTTGILKEKAEDKDGKYLVIDTKKYYFVSEDNDPKIKSADGLSEYSFNTLWGILDAGKRVEFDTNSDNEITNITQSDVDLEGLAQTPQYSVSGGVYKVWLPIKAKNSDNYPGAADKYLLATYDADETALIDMIDDGEILQALPGSEPAYPACYTLDTDAKTYVNGSKVELYDVKAKSYVTADLNDDATQKVTKVSDYTKSAYGLVESIEKSSDKVASVTINGTKYTYDGDSDKYASSTKGKVSLVGGNTASETIETGYFVSATLDASGNIISFNKLTDPDYAKVTVTAKAGQTSHYSVDNDTSKNVNVPSDCVEVQLESGAYAWVTFDDDSSDNVTTSISVKGTKELNSFVVGESAYISVAGVPDINNASSFAQTTVAPGVAVTFDTNTHALKLGGVTTYTPVVASHIFQK